MTKIIVDESILEHLAQEKDLFSRTEFSIIPCATKEQAYKIHSEEIADLIIIDFDMPEMNVESFCAHVRTNKKLKHVSIAIACENKRDYLDRCLMCGVNALIIKPVYHKELIDNVIKLLNIKKREDTRVLLRISLVGSTTGTFYATAQNISVSGMLIETDKAVSRGDKVSLSFYFRLNKITITGEVVRKKEKVKNFYQYGIRFLSIDGRSRSLIEDFVKMRQAV